MSDRKQFPRSRAVLVAGLATLGLVALAPALAQAGVIAAAGPDFPSTVTVGQQDVGATLTLFNINNGGEVDDTNQVCNTGDPTPCRVDERGIELVPTCGVLAGSACTAADPGVFAMSATGVGLSASPGASCVGIVFDITPIPGDAFGAVRFTPQGGQHVALPGRPSTLTAPTFCEIAFTFDVLKSPALDQDPSTPLTQTGQAADSLHCVIPCAPGSLSARGLGTDSGTTVLRAGPPSITTIASGNIALGGQLTDQATVTGLTFPVAGATVTFRLYPPSDSNCTGDAVYTNTQTVTLSGATATATSGAHTPTTAGGYHWIATYNGDANNLPVSGACGEATETRTVTPPPPPPPPPAPPCTPPPGPAPPGGVLCATPPTVCTPPPGPAPSGGVLCARGTAAIRGRTGCAGSAFRVTVRGREISRVVFRLDGRVVRTLTRPNSGSIYVLRVDPRRMRTGVHRVLARTSFTRRSGTRARTLRVTFSKCARTASSPAFTG